MTAPHVPDRYYARFNVRFTAVIIDALVLIGWFVVVTMVFKPFDDSSTKGSLMFASVVLALLLYEPLMVWRMGGTIGHRSRNLRVVSDATGGNPTLGAAFARHWIKGILGVFSFVTLTLTSRHQAIHDAMTGTTVQPREVSEGDLDDFVEAVAVVENGSMPSRGRRIAVILGYSVLLFVFLSIASAVLISDACTLSKQCTAGEQLMENVLGFALLGGAAIIIVLGWRGRLFGARGSAEALRTDVLVTSPHEISSVALAPNNALQPEEVRKALDELDAQLESALAKGMSASRVRAAYERERAVILRDAPAVQVAPTQPPENSS